MKVEALIGKRVRIRAMKMEGSARVLDGLTAAAISLHPFALNWVVIELDPNPITPHRKWSIAADRLVVCEADTEEWAEPGAGSKNFCSAVALGRRAQPPEITSCK